jgi:RNA polymerase sigma-70 factor, ECF subfamily
MKLEREHFEQLALEQLDLLYRVARRLTRSPAQAEDLVQETYLRALRAWKTFELKEFGIRPWILRIMHNVHYSRTGRERRQPVAMEDPQLELRRDGSTEPLDSDLFESLDEQLVRALDNLSEEYRVVLLLWAVEELSYKEIAEAVDIPIGTVMSRLHRARRLLAQQLRQYAANEGIIRE